MQPRQRDIQNLDTSSCRPISEKRVVEIMRNTAMLDDPITITSQDTVLNGGHRIEARKRLGFKRILCVVNDDYTTEIDVSSAPNI